MKNDKFIINRLLSCLFVRLTLNATIFIDSKMLVLFNTTAIFLQFLNENVSLLIKESVMKKNKVRLCLKIGHNLKVTHPHE